MNISAPFIERPIATALLMVGLLAGGLVAYPVDLNLKRATPRSIGQASPPMVCPDRTAPRFACASAD
jgi:hypothetical protein